MATMQLSCRRAIAYRGLVTGLQLIREIAGLSFIDKQLPNPTVTSCQLEQFPVIIQSKHLKEYICSVLNMSMIFFQ